MPSDGKRSLGRPVQLHALDGAHPLSFDPERFSDRLEGYTGRSELATGHTAIRIPLMSLFTWDVKSFANV